MNISEQAADQVGRKIRMNAFIEQKKRGLAEID